LSHYSVQADVQGKTLKTALLSTHQPEPERQAATAVQSKRFSCCRCDSLVPDGGQQQESCRPAQTVESSCRIRRLLSAQCFTWNSYHYKSDGLDLKNFRKICNQFGE
jgi:hypothetical protein